MSKIYRKVIRPLLFKVPTEAAHEFGIESLKYALGSKIAQTLAAEKFAVESPGKLTRFGLNFKNPLGVAAGFDKNGRVVEQLAALGFAFVEVGTVTFHPQKGNEKPRLFRLPEDEALINRLGFNNEGTLKVVERLKKSDPKCVLGVNIGKNKDVPNERAIENYLKSFESAYRIADYIAVNVSSPNTPHLRELQKAENLEELLGELQARNQQMSNGAARKPLLLKIAPDLSDSEIEAIAAICLKFELAGIIATNTTVDRNGLKSKAFTQIGGGLSGKPLRARSNEVIRKLYQTCGGKLPIIGVGGVFSAEDAFEKIAAGACLIQSYTGFVYQGLSFARDINVGLNRIVERRGFADLNEVVGSEAS